MNARLHGFIQNKTAYSVALACLLAMLLLVFALPSRALAASGSFAFAVVNSEGNGYVVEPCLISYNDGESLQQALEASDVDITFSGGFISDIEGQGSQLAAYYTGGWDNYLQFNVPADSIDACFVTYRIGDTGTVVELSEDHATLLAQIGAFLARNDGVRNFANAVQAYDNAWSALKVADAEAAATAAQRLQTAMDEYDSLMNGDKYAVNFAIARMGTASADIDVVITDTYGNSTEASASGTVQLIAGSYTYEASALNGRFAVKGAFSLNSGNAGMTVSAQIPSDNWVSAINLLDGDMGKAVMDCTGSFAGGVSTYQVPDYARQTASVYVNPTPTAAGTAIKNSGDKIQFSATYVNVDTGAIYSTNPVNFNTQNSTLSYLVAPGSQGAEAEFAMTHTVSAAALEGTNNTSLYEIERAHAIIQRCPTLSDIEVLGDGSVLLTGFSAAKLDYSLETTAQSVQITPHAAYEGNTITVAGQQYASEPVLVQLAGDTTSIPVVIENGSGASRTYMLSVTKKAGVSVTLTYENGITPQVLSSGGGLVSPVSVSNTQASYTLIDGNTYSYVGTKSEYFHVTNEFTASAGSTVAIPTPTTDDWLTMLTMKSNGSAATSPFPQDSSSTAHNRLILPNDSNTALYVHLTKDASIQDELNNEFSYVSQTDGTTITKTFNSSGYSDGLSQHSANLSGFHRNVGVAGNTGVLTVTNTASGASGETYYQDYRLSTRYYVTGKSLTAAFRGMPLDLIRTSTIGNTNPVTGFDPTVTDYTVRIADSVTELHLSDTLRGADYFVSISTSSSSEQVFSGRDSLAYSCDVPISESDDAITVRFDTESGEGLPTNYLIRIQRLPTVEVVFDVTPDDATVNIVEDASGQRVMPNSEGVYELTQTFSYSWSVGAVGYVSQSGTFVASEETVFDITLEQAPASSVDPTLEADWPSFRLGDDNTSTTTALIPIEEADAVLYWAQKLGSGYSSLAAGCPILVDGYLYSYGSDSTGRAKIYKLDTVTGETVAEGTMATTSSFSITPATYAEGMIFVGLAGGRVEAFDAKTLESLWVYTDPLGGQPNCAISYRDGCIYTGFWTGYTKDANLVCISITDEDPSTPGHIDTVSSSGKPSSEVRDAKNALWTYMVTGGFYWAGACERDGYVVIGSDDGCDDNSGDVDGEGHLFSIDLKSGTIVDEFNGFTGDVRTQVTYDSSSGAYYFATKNGYLNTIKMNDDGTFDCTSFKRLPLYVYGSSTELGRVTSTPAIANGRCYVGVQGSGQFSNYSGHNLSVVDLDAWTVAYSIPTKGYVQTTPVITTGYQDVDGYTYIYFIENTMPGNVCVIRDMPGMFSPDAWSQAGETYTVGTDTIHTATVLFSPKGAQSQYAICSPIVDEYGTLYFKNDSAYMMAVGSTIESLQVTTPPARTDYLVGEEFDSAGMVVTAIYTNGARRDITPYVTCSSNEFTAPGTYTVSIDFPYTMYQTVQGVDTAIPYICPPTSIEVHVVSDAAPTVIGEKLDDALVGSAYSHSFSASANPAVESWQVQGDLPDGLSFDTATGTLSGTPATGSGGLYEFALRATNAEGTGAAVSFTLAVNEAVKLGQYQRSFTITEGEDFEYAVPASGYPLPTWSVRSGYALPAGIQLDAATGVMSGRATTAGSYQIVLEASNGIGRAERTRTITIAVVEASHEVEVDSVNLALVDTIEGTVYFEVPSEVEDGAQAVVTASFLDEPITIPLTQGEVDIVVPCPSKDIATPFTIKLEGTDLDLMHNGIDKTEEGYSTTVKAIAEATLASAGSDELLVALMDALINYCAYVQPDVGYTGDFPMTPLHDPSDASMVAQEVSSYASIREGTLPEGVKIQGLSIINLSRTLLRITYSSPGDGVTFEPDVQVEGGKAIQDSSGIAPNKYDDPITFRAGDYTIQASVCSWIRAATKSSVDSARNVACAMYDYWQAAEAYQNGSMG